MFDFIRITDQKIIKAVDKICNYILGFCMILVVLMFLSQVVRVLQAMEGIN